MRGAVLLLLLCLLAGLGSPAVAADDPATARAVAVMGAHVRTLHDRLHITTAQEPQWAALADAMLANARHVSALHAAQQATNTDTTAPADLRRYVAVAQAHAEDAQRLLAPFEALYGAMTPEQRSAADQAFHRFELERVRKAHL